MYIATTVIVKLHMTVGFVLAIVRAIVTKTLVKILYTETCWVHCNTKRHQSCMGSGLCQPIWPNW